MSFEANRQYEDADVHVENYASLDMTKVQAPYQSLINVKRDVVRFCLVVEV